MKKITLHILLLICIESNLNAQSTFQRSIYSSYIITSTNITSANNGGYMVTGILNPNQDYLSAALLDANGNTKWNRYFNDGVNDFFDVRATQTKDSGFIIARTGLSAAHTYILKTDKSGNLLWSESLNSNLIFFSGYRIVTSDDGGVLLSGRTNDTTGSPAFI